MLPDGSFYYAGKVHEGMRDVEQLIGVFKKRVTTNQVRVRVKDVGMEAHAAQPHRRQWMQWRHTTARRCTVGGVGAPLRPRRRATTDEMRRLLLPVCCLILVVQVQHKHVALLPPHATPHSITGVHHTRLRHHGVAVAAHQPIPVVYLAICATS